MYNKEEILLNCGDTLFIGNERSRNTFKVPEGYFENLQERVMNNIPEQSHAEHNQRAHVIVMHRLRWAAAVACFAVFGVTAYLHYTEQESNETASVSTASNEIIEVADYAMLNNQDVYDIFVDD